MSSSKQQHPRRPAIPVLEWDRDLREAAVGMEQREARFLVYSYYAVQENRIRFSNQLFQLKKSGKPSNLVEYLAEQSQLLEDQTRLSLDLYSNDHPVGSWLREIVGIGPVFAAGLLGLIEIDKCPTAGHILKFAGMVPGQKRTKGEKINWSPMMKKLCFLISESFILSKNHPDSFYGKLYDERRQTEDDRNESGYYAEQAKEILQNKRYNKTTAAYKAYAAGKFPAAHLRRRAARKVICIFLSHLHEVLYWYEYGVAPPAPYAFVYADQKHVHYIPTPNFNREDFPTLRKPCPHKPRGQQ